MFLKGDILKMTQSVAKYFGYFWATSRFKN